MYGEAWKGCMESNNNQLKVGHVVDDVEIEIHSGHRPLSESHVLRPDLLG